jgi:histidyl-tRNA synthetase
MGIERFVDLYLACGGTAAEARADLYVVAVGDGTTQAAFALAEALRDDFPERRIEVNLGGGSFKSQMKRADKSGAQYALVLGETEIANNSVGLKPLRSGEDQINVATDALVATLAANLAPAD